MLIYRSVCVRCCGVNMYICNKCTRRFTCKQNFNNHLTKRQTPCRRPTHYCDSCSNGFLDAKSLWRHRQRCKKMSTISQRGNNTASAQQQQYEVEMEDRALSSNLPFHVKDERHIQKERCNFIEPAAQYEIEMDDGALSTTLPFHVEDERHSEKKQCHFTEPTAQQQQYEVETEDRALSSGNLPFHIGGERNSRRKYAFISEKEFNDKLRQEHAIEWYNLTEGIIYKLDNCHAIDDRVVGRLIDGYNNENFVYLPRFFMDRLLLRDETNIKVFVRRGKDNEEVDIVTVQKWTCETCRRDFSTRNHLNRHIKLCIKEVL